MFIMCTEIIDHNEFREVNLRFTILQAVTLSQYKCKFIGGFVVIILNVINYRLLTYLHRCFCDRSLYYDILQHYIGKFSKNLYAQCKCSEIE